MFFRYLLIRFAVAQHLLRQEKAFGRPMVRTPRAHVARARGPDLSPLQTDGKICDTVSALGSYPRRAGLRFRLDVVNLRRD